MRLWSLGFLAIALLAAVVGLRDDTQGLTVAKVVFGLALLLFAAVLIIRRADRTGSDDT